MRRLLTLGHSVRGRVIGFWAAAECGYTRGPEAGQEVRRQLLARSQALGLVRPAGERVRSPASVWVPTGGQMINKQTGHGHVVAEALTGPCGKRWGWGWPLS